MVREDGTETSARLVRVDGQRLDDHCVTHVPALGLQEIRQCEDETNQPAVPFREQDQFGPKKIAQVGTLRAKLVKAQRSEQQVASEARQRQGVNPRDLLV